MKKQINRLIAIAAFLLCITLLSSCGPDTGKSSPLDTDDIAEYDKSLVIEKYGGDLDSDLSVFPDEILTGTADYSVHFSSDLFDTDGRMILECTYDDEQFSSEISRLQGLSKTITFEDEQFTNKVLYDEASYAYPAYITIDGFGNTFEYALADKSENRIVYIYLSYPDDETLSRYSNYVKKDLSAYEEENTLDSYSMYNHSFDGGESWVEFDDTGN